MDNVDELRIMMRKIMVRLYQALADRCSVIEDKEAAIHGVFHDTVEAEASRVVMEEENV